MSETIGNNIEHRASELAGAFIGHDFSAGAPDRIGSLTFAPGEQQLLEQWERITQDVVASKFDLCVTSAYSSASFDGLNRSLTDKYLSDDLASGFEVSDVLLRGGASRFGNFRRMDGYGLFDYADFEGLVLEEEENLLGDEDFRQAVKTQRKQSLFSRQARTAARARRAQSRQGRAMTRGAGRRASRLALDTPETALVRPERSDSSLLNDTDVDMAGPAARAEFREDNAFSHPYPAALGRAGATMLSRPQRTLSRMRQATRPSRRDAMQRAAQTVARNEAIAGPLAARADGLSQSPLWAPMTVDAVRTPRMYGGALADGIASSNMLLAAESAGGVWNAEEGWSFNAPTAELGVARQAAEQLAGATTASTAPGGVAGEAVSARTADGALRPSTTAAVHGLNWRTPGTATQRGAQRRVGAARPAGAFGPVATQVMLDGLAISSREMPALSGALEVADAAFGPAAMAGGQGGAASYVPGVFSPGRMERALRVVSLTGETPHAALSGPTGDVTDGYRRLLYDAVDHTWVSSDEGMPFVDAADAGATATRGGQPVSPRSAAAQLIAVAMPAQASPLEVAAMARLVTGAPSPVRATDTARSAIEATRPGPTAGSTELSSAVAAPARELAGLDPAAFAQLVAHHADEVRAARSIGAALAGTAVTPGSRVHPATAGQPSAQVATRPALTLAALRDAGTGQDAIRGGFAPRRMSLDTFVPGSSTALAAGSTLTPRATQMASSLLAGPRAAEADARTSAPAGLTGGMSIGIDPISGRPQLNAPTVGTSALTMASIGRGGRRAVGVSSTGSELFAARHLDDSASEMARLVRPEQGPVSIAGEVRYGYGALGSPMDDPVVYVNAQDPADFDAATSTTGARAGGLKVPASGLSARSHRMSPAVSANLSSVTMPLSSAARLQRALTTPTARAEGAAEVTAAEARYKTAAPQGRMQAATTDLVRLGGARPASRFDAATSAGIPRPAGGFDAALTKTLAGPQAIASLLRSGATGLQVAIDPTVARTSGVLSALGGRDLIGIAGAQTLGVGADRAPTTGEVAAMRTAAGTDAPAPGIGATELAWVGAPRGASRTSSGIAGRMTAAAPSEGFATALSEAHFAGTDVAGGLNYSLGGPADLLAGSPSFYQFSYDAETTFLRSLDEGGGLAGAGALGAPGRHVEIRDGRVVRAVPATRAAQRAAATRPASRRAAEGDAVGIIPSATAAALAPSVTQATSAAFARSLTSAGLIAPPSTPSERLRALSSEGIETAGSSPIVIGASRTESGFPAMALAAGGAAGGPSLRLAQSVGDPRSTGALAAIADAELAMLPPMVRALTARQGTADLAMTRAGTDPAGLLARVAALADPSAPATRAALMHKLAALGVDTPELLRMIDEGAPLAGDASAADTPNLLSRNVAAKLSGRDVAARLRAGDRAGAAELLRASGMQDATAITTTLDSLAQATSVTLAGDAAEALVTATSTARADALATQLQTITSQLTGVPGAAAGETSLVGTDAYWGPYAPARMVRSNATDLLASLLASRGKGSRASALAYGAELGEMLALGSSEFGGIGTSAIAQAETMGRRKSAAGAPSRAAQLMVAERRAKRAQRRAQAAERKTLADRTEEMATTLPTAGLDTAGGREAARAGRRTSAAAHGWDGEAMPMAALEAAERGSEPGLVDRMMDDMAAAVASSLDSGSAVSATIAAGSNFGWDAQDLPLAAFVDSPGVADRVSGAGAPWASPDGAPSRKAAREESIALTRMLTDRGSLLTGALGEADAGRAQTGRGQVDLGPLDAALISGGSQEGGAHGSRGFRSPGMSAIDSALGALPGTRGVSKALRGNLEMAYGVLDRVNGHFAGLHAGVLESLTRLVAASAREAVSGADRTLFPGFDEWPQETLETLQGGGFGGVADSQPSDLSRREQQAVRLEKRIGAAREAYARMQGSRGGASRDLDSMDWSLVNTGAANDAPRGTDLGLLANTMVRSTQVPDTQMSYVAPAVKVVAQQAQLKPKSEPTRGGGGGGGGATEGLGAEGVDTQKVNYGALASQIARRLQRRWARDGDRYGRTC